MTTARPAWPVKTRDIHNHHFDSTAWDGFRFRDDDIIIGTYGKSGTTSVPQIVSQLIFVPGTRTSPSPRCRHRSTCACRPTTVRAHGNRKTSSTDAFSRPESSGRCARLFPPRPARSISAATAVTWCRACTTTTPVPTSCRSRRR